MCCGILVGQGHLEDDLWWGCSKTLTTDEQVDTIHHLCLIDQFFFCPVIGLSSGLFYSVLIEILGMSKLSSTWVPRMLIPEHKLKMLTFPRQFWLTDRLTLRISTAEFPQLKMKLGFITLNLNQIFKANSWNTLVLQLWSSLSRVSFGKVIASVFLYFEGVIKIDNWHGCHFGNNDEVICHNVYSQGRASVNNAYI